MNPDRLVLGLVLPFGTPNSNDMERYYAPQLRNFVDLYGMDPAVVPMVFGHPKGPLPQERLGWWHTFAVADGFDGRPPGLLGLGEFAGSPWAFGMLDQLRETPDSYGFSPEVVRFDTTVLIEAVGLTFTRSNFDRRRPAFAGTDVLAVGPGSLDEWQRITGSAVPPLPSRPMQTLSKLMPTDAGLRQVEWQEPASYRPFQSY